MHDQQARLRSMLFVPADNARKLQKASAVAADALIIDLEDSVALEAKPSGRAMLAEYVAGYAGSSQIWVRINDLAFDDVLDDIFAAVLPGVAGLVVPKANAPQDVEAVAHYVAMMERVRGLDAGSIGLMPLCTETPAAVLRLPEYASMKTSAAARIRALMWGAEDLSSAMGARRTRDADGNWLPVYAHARSQCLLAAHALGVAAIDTVYVDFRDREGLARHADAARQEGFSGKLAIHPDQVPVINAAFLPSEADVAWARKVIAAMEASPGAASLDGAMLDLPHRRAAERILARCV